jgi:DTW domain-containing protein YfiP
MTAKRRVCEGCGRPETVCLCSALTRTDSRVSVVIWQDPVEAKHPLSTAPLLHRSLRNSRLVVGEQFSFQDVFGDTCVERVAVLFPFEHDRMVTRGEQVNIEKLLILDGTWRKVRKIILVNPWLTSIPYLMLRPDNESRYEVRTSPRSDGLSTLEAGVAALTQLENTDRYHVLIAVLDRMVELQKNFGHKQECCSCHLKQK